MRTTLLTLALLAATTVARAGDLDKLQGRWECRGGPKRDVSVSLEFKGEGESLKLCNGGFSGGRPAEFKPGEGPLAEVVVMGRPAEAREQPVASIAPAR